MHSSCLIALLGSLVHLSSSSAQLAGEEGVLVGKISFEGVKSFPEKMLRQKMRSKTDQPFDEFLLRQDMKRIERFYQEKGFLSARVTEHRLSRDPQATKVDVNLTVKEGARTAVRTIGVAGNESVRGKQILRRITLKAGQPLDEEAIAYSELAILALYANSGHVHAEVTVSKEPTDEPLQKDVIFKIEEGPLVRVGTVDVEGRKKVRPRIVEREITFQHGDIYVPDKVYESQRRIYGTGLFRDVKLELSGIEERSEIVDVTFRLTEQRPRWFGVGFGYESPDRMKLNGEWGHNNVFNNGQRLTIGGSYSFNLKGEHREELEARHLEPYFVSSAFKLMLHPFHYRERRHSYRSTETGGSGNIGRYLGRYLYGSFQAKYKVATVQVFAQEGLPDFEATTNSIALSFTRDTRDSYFDPKSGSFNFLSLERAGGILGGSNNFTRLIIDSSIFLRVWRRATLAMRVKEGYTTTFGLTTAEKVSSDQRFELGGANSLRGYPEASVGPTDPVTGRQSGIILTNLNLELRFPFPIVKNLDIGYFLDGGGVWMQSEEIKVSELRWGAGVGLRWIIPYLGPLRFDWGWKLAPKEDEERWKWYLAFGHAF